MNHSDDNQFAKSVYSWLALELAPRNANKQNRTACQEDIEVVETLLKNEKATAFFLVWPIMERKLFRGEVTISSDPRKKDKPNHIKNFSKDNANLYQRLRIKLDGVESTNFDSVASYFHNRFRCDAKYKKLFHCRKGRTEKIPNDKHFYDLILDKEDFSTLSDEDKLCLLLIVTFRYRNNIFHGNKHIEDWLDFSKQIEYCVEFMMQLIDAYKEEHKN